MNSQKKRPTEKEIKEEERKLRKLRILVDLYYSFILQMDIPVITAWNMVEDLKRKACELFPGKEDTFELIYGTRFRRLIKEKYGLKEQ